MRFSAMVALLGLLGLPHTATAGAKPAPAALAGRARQMERIVEAQAAAAALPGAPDAAALREIEERFITALELDPGSRPARAAVAVFYRAHGEQQAPPSKTLLELIARDADPAALALSLVCPADEGTGSIL